MWIASVKDPVLHVQSPALGAAVAALGLSNKAVYAEDMQDSNGGVASGMEGGNYTDGPDMAPNAAPAAVAGQLARPCLPPVAVLLVLVVVTCVSVTCSSSCMQLSSLQLPSKGCHQAQAS